MNAKHRIDVAEAVALIAKHMPQYDTRTVPLADAHGEILRQTISAERDQPPFDRVTMDGIAIEHAGIEQGRREFNVIGIQAAGVPALTLGDPSNCVEIMTGASLPADADTVIPVERIKRSDNLAILEAGYKPDPGQFIHRRATDHAAGDTLLEAGMEITPPEVAALTIGGHPQIEVAQWPKIAVISTGNELVDAGMPITDFQIRSSNGLAIAASLEKRRCMTSSQAHLPDDPNTLLKEISSLHDTHDVLILSGGVSMGKYDYVPQILSKLKVALVFHKILQRPGLPMWFGISAAGKPVFALPGNPVSSLVCLVRYVLPALRQAMNATPDEPRFVRLAESVQFTADLTCFMPVTLTYSASGELTARPRRTNTSGDFASLAGTDGFIELERGRDEYPAGYAGVFFDW
jgi:molybdopterin molybdotransferase